MWGAQPARLKTSFTEGKQVTFPFIFISTAHDKNLMKDSTTTGVYHILNTFAEKSSQHVFLNF